MIYSKEDILLESAYESNISAIFCKGDMLVENFCTSINYSPNEDVYLEAAGKAFDTIQATAKAVFNAIREFISKQIEKLDLIINGKKYKQMMSPEMQKVLAAAKDKKAGDFPDLVKAKRQVEKMNKFVENYLSKFDAMLPKLIEDPKGYKDKCSKFIDASAKEYAKMCDEFDSIMSDKKPVKPLDVIKMAKCGIDIKTSVSDFKDTISKHEKQITSTLGSVNSIIGKKDAEESGTDVASDLKDAKSTINKGLTETKNMGRKIGSIALKVGAVLSAFMSVLYAADAKFDIGSAKRSDEELQHEETQYDAEWKKDHTNMDRIRESEMRQHNALMGREVSKMSAKKNGAMSAATALGSVVLHSASKKLK